jgi:hypothetical protein
MMLATLPESIAYFRLASSILDDTWALLRGPGAEGFESVVLWIGKVTGPTTVHVLQAIRPQQIAYRSSEGCAVEIPPEAIGNVITALDDGEFILARVHTHPTDAYHSDTDDQNMLIAHTGAISIVVPHFAQGPASLATTSVNELRSDGSWRLLPTDEVSRRFVTPATGETDG